MRSGFLVSNHPCAALSLEQVTEPWWGHRPGWVVRAGPGQQYLHTAPCWRCGAVRAEDRSAGYQAEGWGGGGCPTPTHHPAGLASRLRGGCASSLSRIWAWRCALPDRGLCKEVAGAHGQRVNWEPLPGCGSEKQAHGWRVSILTARGLLRAHSPK